MKLAMIGLGKMGANMTRRLMQGGHEVVVFDLDPDNVVQLGNAGATPATSIENLVQLLEPPRVAWVMVPAGTVTDKVVSQLGSLLGRDDVVVDGGNSFYKDDVRRHRQLAERGVRYVDVGTSGGVWGAERGYCLMVGGDEDAVELLTPVLRTLAPGEGNTPVTPGRENAKTAADEGFLHCGPAGAGHFVKMVHNGIEYGVMQAYAEGFDLLHSASKQGVPEDLRYDLDLPEIAEVWRRGSVIGSWLLDLTSMALIESPTLQNYSGHVSDSGEGRWTVQTAVERAVPADVLTAALYTRFRSRQEHTFAEKILSAMRHKFGGHVEPPSVD